MTRAQQNHTRNHNGRPQHGQNRNQRPRDYDRRPRHTSDRNDRRQWRQRDPSPRGRRNSYDRPQQRGYSSQNEHRPTHPTCSMCRGRHHAPQCPDKDVTWCSFCIKRGHTIDRCRYSSPATGANRATPSSINRRDNRRAPHAPLYDPQTQPNKSKPQPNIHPERAAFIAQATANEEEMSSKHCTPALKPPTSVHSQ